MHLPGQVTLFHWHYESFDIPRGATRTMYGRHCLNKGFRRGRQWAFQGHLEVTPESIRAWCAAGRDELQCACGPAVQTEAQILGELSARALELRATAHQVYGAWTDQIARPFMALRGGRGR
ncbi:glutamine amidotransferase [compost metagenome]